MPKKRKWKNLKLLTALLSIVLCLVPTHPQADTGTLHKALTLRESLITNNKNQEDTLRLLKPHSWGIPTNLLSNPKDWRKNIFTTIFWIGEKPTPKNPVPNDKSSWDTKWMINYGGYDCPKNRDGFLPKNFSPKLNPFYIALPYNDIDKRGTKPEAPKIIPWFTQTFRKNGKSVVKGQWIAIHYKGRICYAQWEDTGPFKTNDWPYVFLGKRPQARAGLDISPAVRDYLGLKTNDYTDWKFVHASEVPRGPWSKFGENNPFSPSYQTKNPSEFTQQQNSKNALTKQ